MADQQELAVREKRELRDAFQQLLVEQGIELAWART